MLTLDRIRVTGSGLDGGHIEWNCPGEVAEQTDGFRVAQQGVYFDVTSVSGWQTEQGVSDRSASWTGVLESGAYPYAKWPLKKLMHKMPAIPRGGTGCLAVLLAATREDEPAYRISEPSPGLVRIETADGGLPALSINDDDLSIRGGGSAIEIGFGRAPDLPLSLRVWAAR